MRDEASVTPPPSLGDSLAIERTALANERTLLSYVRTALGLAGGGLSLAHFFPLWPLGATGDVLSGAGALVCIAGFVRFFRVRRRMRSLQRLT